MNLYTINYIKNNELVYRYLREDSYWYKYLNRDSSVLSTIEELAKKKYQVRAEDRLKKLSDDIGLISTLLNVIK